MKLLLPTLAALAAAFCLAGCCHPPGCGDPCGGIVHGGGGHSGCPVLGAFSRLRCHGCGACGSGVAPAAPCCPAPYAPAPMPGAYPGTVVPTPVSSGYPTHTVPSVPAGIYEEAPPPKPVPKPPSDAKAGSIILQKHRSGNRRQGTPSRDARNRHWLPAGL